MRMRPYFSSAAFVATLLATSAHFSGALAQKAAVLSPMTPWAVTKVDGSGGQGGYCAMARRFKQNTILTLARNGSDETSLALDFQAPKLTTGENIKVVLDPGAGQQRSYYISPVSAQAFVVRLGRDVKFFAALETTGFLRVDAAGQSYSFDLADIDSGQTKLISCVDSAGQAGDGGGAMREASAAAGSGIHAELESLRRDVQSLQKENTRLSGLAEQTAGALNAPSIVAQNLASQADALERENESLRTGMSAGHVQGDEIVLNHLTRENKRLQNLLSQKPGRSSITAVESLQNQLQSLRSERIWMASDIAEARDDAAEALQAITPAAGDEPTPSPEMLVPPTPPVETPPPAAVEQPVPPAPVEAAADPQQKIEELMAELRQKDEKLVELSSLTMEVENLRAKNNELEQKLLEGAKDKETIAALNEKIRNLEEENERLTAQIGQGGAGSEQMAALTKENAELEQQVEQLKQQAQQVAEAAPAATPAPAPSGDEIAKIKREADIAKQNEMQGLAKENMALKQRLAELAGGAAAVQAPATSEPETISEAMPEDVAPEPMPEAEPAPEPKEAMAEPGPEHIEPAPIQEVIVSAPPEQMPEGATEAQRQEAEMMGTTVKPAAPDNTISWNSPPASPPPQQQAEMKQPEPDTAPAPAESAEFSIKDVLVSARIAEASQLQKVEKASVNGRSAYQWRSGAVYGSAEQKPLADVSRFDAEVSQYLDKTKKRCPGDFAASPDDNLQNGSDRIASYEIACLGKNLNSSASLLFVGKGETFTVVAHETSSDKMADAMNLRDRLMKAITGK